MAILPEVKKHYGRLKFFINGEWIESKSNNCFENTNPATGDVIAEVPVATEAEVEAAINSAWNAFKNGVTCPSETGQII